MLKILALLGNLSELDCSRLSQEFRSEELLLKLRFLFFTTHLNFL